MSISNTDFAQAAPRAATGDAFLPFGKSRIAFINAGGLWTLYLKEVRRFMKVQMQTVWAPAATTLLFLFIFTVALGRQGRIELGVPFADFLAPGLIMMAMLQNSFANTSSSVLIAKVQGTIIDILMPPLSAGELMIAFIGGAVTRAAAVGASIALAMMLAPNVRLHVSHVWAIVYFGVMGSAMLGLTGVLTGLWAEKFDHAATITNFVIQPLSLLSGTFYTIERLGGVWHMFSAVNPFFYLIDGFRYGLIGAADSNIAVGAAVIFAINTVLAVLTYVLLRRGYKLKA